MYVEFSQLHGSLVHHDRDHPVCLVNWVSKQFFFQYEVEVYQRIEQLLDTKLEVYPTVKEEALILEERIAEAERFAKMVSQLLVSFHQVNTPLYRTKTF